MSDLRRGVLKLVHALWPGRGESDLTREIDSHLAILEDEFQRRGMTPEDARLAARRAFGGVEQAKELQRDARSFRWLTDARQDARYAARMLRRAPGFTNEMRAFESSLAREGLNFKDVSTGAYLDKGNAEPGKPCLMLETLHLAIARLPEGTRRKIYAGMFFLGRDK